MKKSSILVFSYPLPLSAVSLGRLITFIEHPAQDFFDATKKLPEKPQFESSTSDANNISKLLAITNKGGIELALTAFAKNYFKGEKRDVRSLSAEKGTERLLQQADDWFQKICASKLTQEWLERAASRGRKLYLVTGLRTLSSASFKLVDQSHSIDAKAGVELPAHLHAAAGGSISASKGEKGGASISDEMVYEVQYREVKLGKGRAAPAAAASLSPKIFWEPTFTFRAASETDLEQDNDDIIEAELLDGFENTSKLTSVESGAGDGVVYFYESKFENNASQ